ncbi:MULTISPECIES: DUF4333 domain-containing protein [unclassified Pseudoclavibacter]|uniref:DUF4333 domain-containing protein n=1 Tax=unclassified Pseudoclavibacter TaxID=2615177 RepID=UPI001BA95295|nr:DUF4333 domain-containing protein [Pseudoclavibacter sp. Marseille-Q4354]MBS3179282.1 DUF4333 domain-containing protein [Pseudoclavibacter sp. Marseille-Q4354]
MTFPPQGGPQRPYDPRNPGDPRNQQDPRTQEGPRTQDPGQGRPNGQDAATGHGAPNPQTPQQGQYGQQPQQNQHGSYGSGQHGQHGATSTAGPGRGNEQGRPDQQYSQPGQQYPQAGQQYPQPGYSAASATPPGGAGTGTATGAGSGTGYGVNSGYGVPSATNSGYGAPSATSSGYATPNTGYGVPGGGYGSSNGAQSTGIPPAQGFGYQQPTRYPTPGAPGSGFAAAGPTPNGKPRRNSRLLLILAIPAAALIAGLGGYFIGESNGSVLAAEPLQAEVTRVLQDDFGLVEVSDVTCPEQVKADQGSEFQCTFTYAEQDQSVTVTVSSADGQVVVGAPE